MSADRQIHTHTHIRQLMSYELVYTSIHSSINVILDAIDCLLCNAGCCNMKHVTLLKIGSGYAAEHFRSSNFVFPRVKNNIIVCVDAYSNIQLYLIVLSYSC